MLQYQEKILLDIVPVKIHLAKMTSLSSVNLSRSAFTSNVLAYRKLLLPSQQLIAVVKANAYGHGLREVVHILDPYVDAFQVDDIEEALVLREGSAKKVYILGYVAPHSVEHLAHQGDFVVTVLDPEHGKALDSECQRRGITLAVVLSCDMEFGREGTLPSHMRDTWHCSHGWRGLSIQGIYSHFSSADDKHSHNDTEKVTRQFLTLIDSISELPNSMKISWTSIANTPGVDVLSQKGMLPYFTAIRVGLGLYGMSPSSHHCLLSEVSSPLRWTTHVAQIKILPKGHSLGYGRSVMLCKDTTVALIPQGYSDGVSRRLSGCGGVLIRGRRCPFLGRISMNMSTVDVSQVPEVSRGDEVVILGTQGEQSITPDYQAKLIGTINYEVTTIISSLLPRVIVE
jgi:alanine racemase